MSCYCSCPLITETLRYKLYIYKVFSPSAYLCHPLLYPRSPTNYMGVVLAQDESMFVQIHDCSCCEMCTMQHVGWSGQSVRGWIASWVISQVARLWEQCHSLQSFPLSYSSCCILGNLLFLTYKQIVDANFSLIQCLLLRVYQVKQCKPLHRKTDSRS